MTTLNNTAVETILNTELEDGFCYIATYGSLRRGMGNFRVNAYGDGEFFSQGKTVDNFNLYNYCEDCYPSLSLAHNYANTRVVVDVFKAPLSGLRGAYDSLEGYREGQSHNHYNRTEIQVELDDGQMITAWIYHIDEDQGEDKVVKDGDWCRHMADAKNNRW